MHVLKGKEKKLERNKLRNNQFSNEMKDSRISLAFFLSSKEKKKKRNRICKGGKHALCDPTTSTYEIFH